MSQLQSALWCFSAISTIRCNLCCKLGTFSGSTLSDMFSLVLNVRDSSKHIFCSKMVDNNLAQNVTYPAAGSKMIQKCLKIWDKMSHAITASPCSCCLNFAFATLQWLWFFFILSQHQFVAYLDCMNHDQGILRICMIVGCCVQRILAALGRSVGKCTNAQLLSSLSSKSNPNSCNSLQPYIDVCFARASQCSYNVLLPGVLLILCLLAHFSDLI